MLKDNTALMERLCRFIGIRQEHFHLLAAHAPALLARRDLLGKEFYWYLLKSADTAELLNRHLPQGSEGLVSRQLDHLANMLSQELDADGAGAVVMLGRLHYRLGVSMVWVAGAYERYLAHLLGRLAEMAVPAELNSRLVRAINKRILLDQMLQLHGYQQAMEEESHRQNLHAQAMSRLYATLNGVSLVLSRAETRERMFQAICDVCVAEGGFSHTSIRWLDDNTSLLQAVACSSEPGADFSLNQPPSAAVYSVYGQGPSGRALRTRSVQLVNNVNEDASLAPWHEWLQHNQIRSLLVAPLVLQHKAVGTLSLYSRQLGFFDDAKVELVKTMASEVGRSLERHDVMERNRKNESELAFLSHHDRLTGLPNRQLMEDHITRLISSESDSARLAVMVVSINNFHEVNARLGHEGGDIILCEVARRLRKEVYPFGYVGRVGASRFIACTDRFDQLDGLINQLMARLQSPVNCMGAVVETSSSVGVAVEFKNQAEARTLLRRADLALSRAKEKSGSQFRYYDEKMDEQIQRMHSLRSEFANALLRNELELFYQPKIDLHTREVVGAEALVRWYRDNRFVPPGEFFPAIEDTDLMRKLDWWVLREAIRHAQEWQGEGRVIPVSVNLSAMTLKHDSFVPGIEALMAAYPLPVGHLELEVLESVSQQEAEQVVAKLERCRELGLLIALDDFGTGASSLVHLQQLPFDTIKIDQRFVRRLLEAPGNEAIVRSMVSFAHYSDRKLVVEGVENQPIWARLLELGCTSGQGYGISPPMASRQLPGWIDGWETSDINLDYNI